MKYIFTTNNLIELRDKILDGIAEEPWTALVYDNGESPGVEEPVNYSEYVVKLAEYLTFEAITDGEIGWWTDPNSEVTPHIYWSKDRHNWTEFTQTAQAPIYVSVTAGESLYVRGTNPNGVSTEYNVQNRFFNKFAQQSGTWNISGNIMSIIDHTRWLHLDTMIGNFYALFGTPGTPENQNLLGIDIINSNNLLLPAIHLTNDCYRCMFQYCSNMINSPNLFATELTEYCYRNMFWGCSNLVSAPELPAKQLADYCYYGMFYGCSSLTSIPELPANKLAINCYERMFMNCTSLETVCELPAMNLAIRCYYGMFSGCISLTTAQTILPAVNLPYGRWNEAGSGWDNNRSNSDQYKDDPRLSTLIYNDGVYSFMFNMCSNLINAPVLPAKQLSPGCYSCMFQRCNKLDHVVVLAESLQVEIQQQWVDDLYALVSQGGGQANKSWMEKCSSTCWIEHTGNKNGKSKTKWYHTPQAHNDWIYVATEGDFCQVDESKLIQLTQQEIDDIVAQYNIKY